jgi:hypothetical protein
MAGAIGIVIAPPESLVVAVTTNCAASPVLW